MKLKFALIFSVCALSTGLCVSEALAANTSSADARTTNEKLSLQLSQQKEKVKKLEAEITRLRETIDNLRSQTYAPGSTAASQAVIQKTHTIQESETVTQIANKYDISRASLMKENNIVENQQIYIGDELIIPAAPASKEELVHGTPAPKPVQEQAPPPKKKQTTTIAWTQAEKVEVKDSSPPPDKTVAPKPQKKKVEAPKAKPVTVVKTKPEQKTDIVKPSPPKKETSQASATEVSETKTNSDDPSFTYYTIKFGDNLGKIAKKHGITIGALMNFNNIKNPDKISGGQKLKIPSKEKAKSLSKVKPSPSPTVVSSDDKPLPGDAYGAYTVQTGDTLYGLARDFFTTEKEIQTLNKMGSNTNIVPGQDLIVPTAEYFKRGNLANN